MKIKVLEILYHSKGDRLNMYDLLVEYKGRKYILDAVDFHASGLGFDIMGLYKTYMGHDGSLSKYSKTTNIRIGAKTKMAVEIEKQLK